MNERHKRFCDEYLANGLNGTQAYLSVYKSVKSDEVAAVNASKLLRNTKVIEFIKQEQEKTSSKLEITRESVLMDLQRIKENNEGDNPQTSLKALDLIIKVLGFNAPTEQKINLNTEQPLFGPLNNKNKIK
jgi:phage terminase small subunit